MCFGDQAVKALGTVYASFILILIVTAMLVASYQVLNNGLNKTSQAMYSNIRKMEAIAKQPLLDLTYINNSLYLVVQPVEPIKLEYVFIDYMNGTIIFDKIDHYIENTTYIKLPITQYTQPFKIGIIIDPGITIYYNPIRDPWITGRNIVPNTTYIDQNLITALQESNDLSIQVSQPLYNPVFRNNTIIIKNASTKIIETYVDLLDAPLRIELKISKLVSPTFTMTYPKPRSTELKSNGVAKIASLNINGYTLNIYGVYATFTSPLLFSVVGLFINSTSSTNIIFRGSIRVEQSMKPTVVNLGWWLVAINNQYLNTPLALAPLSNTSINLIGKQYVKQVGVNKETFLSINGSLIGNITSDGLIMLGYGRYVKNVWGAPAQINLTVVLNITSLEFINIEPRPVNIKVYSKYITVRQWRIGISLSGTDRYAKGLFNLIKYLGYQYEQPQIIMNYGNHVIYRNITGTNSPIYVTTNNTIEIRPSIPKWVLQWCSPLRINVITTLFSVFHFQYFRVIGNTKPSNTTVVYVMLLPDIIIMQEYPSKRTFLIVFPHFPLQISINTGNAWQYLTSIYYAGTNATIINPTNNTIYAPIIPLYLQTPDNSLTLYYKPRVLETTYPTVTLKPGENIISLELSTQYYLVVPLQQNYIGLEPLILRVI